MQLEFALFCNAAEVSSEGLIDILRGGYDIVSATGFPAKMAKMSLVVRLLCDADECGRDHQFLSQMIDPLGNPLPPTETTISFSPPVYPGNPARQNRMTLRVEYWGLEFPVAGDYTFRFLVDGVQVGTAGIQMKQI
jgi:hypothetical protein